MRERLRRTLGGVGRTLVATGMLILLFVGYQLWGTGYFTSQEQDKKIAEFHKLQQGAAALKSSTTSSQAPSTSNPSVTTTTQPKSSPVVGAGSIPQFKPGDAAGIIHMPWGEYAIIEGTARDDLKKGPGHYPATVFPGQLGNAAIAGHRTTYLHPFFDLDTMHTGTEFKIDVVWGSYTYRVTKEPFAVKPGDVWVAGTCAAFSTTDTRKCAQGSSPQRSTITLTACNPKYSARERLVVQAELVVAKSPRPKAYVKPTPAKPTTSADNGAGTVGPQEDVSLREGLDGAATSKAPAIFWGMMMLLVGALWWWVYRHWRHPLTWLTGLLPFLPVLLAFYFYLEQALPAGY